MNIGIELAPALRQPKIIVEEKRKNVVNDVPNVILTLKNKESLVITSDAYHGIIMGREMYRCVFCKMEIELNSKSKELHKNIAKHKKILEDYPHLEDFGQNLIRKMDKSSYYCTLCTVIVSSMLVFRHTSSESHIQQLKRAISKSSTYTPSQ
ncbi:hypothetical protein ACJJTC_007875 [Scirpophaga incertulas]